MTVRSPLVIGGVTLIIAGCTFVSGVEELELRDPNQTATAPSSNDAGKSVTTPPSFGGSSSSSSSSGSSSGSGSSSSGGATKDAGTVPRPTDWVDTGKQCGAQGSWTKCEQLATIATCATQCLAMGLTCVDSCCAQDTTPKMFAAKVGMVYAAAGLTCDSVAVPSNSSAGLCADPILPLSTEIRCCCR